MANFAFRFTMSVLFLVGAYLVIKNGTNLSNILNTATSEATDLVKILQGRGTTGLQTASVDFNGGYGSYV